MKYPDYEAAADAFIEKLKELSAGTGEMVALGVEMRMIVAAVDAALEGDLTADVGDFIIKGVKGEFYSCREEIFWLTYEKVDDAVQR